MRFDFRDIKQKNNASSEVLFFYPSRQPWYIITPLGVHKNCRIDDIQGFALICFGFYVRLTKIKPS